MNFTTQNSTLPYLSLVREKVKVKICTSVTLLGVATLLTGLTPNVQALPAQTLITQVNTEEVFQQGLDKIDAGDYEAAVEILTKVLEQNPNDVEAYYNRGLAFVQLKDYEKAIADYTEVLKRTPDDGEAYYNRGLARAELADDQGAIADYTEVIKRKADHAEAYYNRGLAYAELEEDKKAVEDLQKAAELFGKQGKSAESQQALALIKKLQP